MVEVCPQCDIAGCYHIREREADPISPARVEAMARELCRTMGQDPDERALLGIMMEYSGERKIYSDTPEWKRIEPPAREFIAMMDAYERTKG